MGPNPNRKPNTLANASGILPIGDGHILAISKVSHKRKR